MASDLAERYREAGNEDLAEEVESPEKEFDSLVAEAMNLDEKELRQMSHYSCVSRVSCRRIRGSGSSFDGLGVPGSEGPYAKELL